jgi:hypothetical protein
MFWIRSNRGISFVQSETIALSPALFFFEVRTVHSTFVDVMKENNDINFFPICNTKAACLPITQRMPKPDQDEE